MYMDAELPEKTTADVIGRMDVCTDPEGNPQAELVLKLFGPESYQAFCRDDGDELEPNTTKQELAEKLRQEKEKTSISKTKNKVESTSPGSKGASRPANMAQEKTPSHPRGGSCRTQQVLHPGPVAPGSKGTSRPVNMTQEKTPSNPRGGTCRTQ